MASKKKNNNKNTLFFDEIVQNAFDFLETAFNEFKEKPKYSVIHFCTAIELLLKARLMHEHWSLIVDKNPDIEAFKKGDFKSLGFKDLPTKIEKVLNEKIPDDATKCFKKIADHRNRMMHFFHEANDSADPKLLEDIVMEQCAGWFYLRRLLEQWKDIFQPYENKITALNQSMKGHREYLRTVYEKIKSDIETKKNEGARYRTCSSCKYEASRESALTDHIIKSKCEVCLLEERFLRVTCGCENKFDIQSGEKPICPECKETLEPRELEEQLDTEPATSENYFDYTEINCANCGGYHTVVRHKKFYICLECFDIEDSMEICEWCQDGQTGNGNLEDSYFSGCEYCEGSSGWKRDD